MGIVKYTGPVASFHCPTNAEIRSLKVYFSPKQEGSGDPSPENVREIVGWDGVEVYINGSTTNYEFGVLGKNKLNIGTVSFTGYKKYEIEGGLMPATYTASALITSEDEDSTKSLMLFQNETGTIKQIFFERDTRNAITFTLTQPATSVYIYSGDSYQRSVGDTTTWSDVQLELGSTATAYEPYDPNNTVYGGWVDLISGEVCEEWNTICVKDLPGEWSYKSSNTRFQITLPSQYLNGPTGIWNNENIMSETYKTSSSNGYGDKQIAQYSNRYVYIRDDDFEGDVDAFLAAVGNTKIAYKLPTSVSYTLAPTQLQTFLGQNNVWSNADYVEVEYDLHETQDILNRKAFIIANQPHIVKPAAASLQNFKTDLVAPLKECKVHFSPVQEGTGDPSPDNVRAISGWTGVEVYHGYEYLSNVQITTGKTLNSSGAETTESGMAVTDYIPVEVGHTYTLKFTSTTAGRTRRIFGYSASKESTSQLASVSWATVGNTFSMNAEIPSGTSYIRACYYNNDIDKTLTEPSAVTTLPIDWITEAGTVYGGYVDLTSGEVWETYHEINITELGTYRTLSINKNNNTQVSWFLVNHLNAPDATGYIAYSRDGYCSCVPFYVNNYYWDSKCQVNNSTVDLVIEGELTAEEVDNWIKAHAPIQIVYPLKTPELIGTITPTQLKTLRGTNNIWSTANGNINISYWSH